MALELIPVGQALADRGLETFGTDVVQVAAAALGVASCAAGFAAPGFAAPSTRAITLATRGS